MKYKKLLGTLIVGVAVTACGDMTAPEVSGLNTRLNGGGRITRTVQTFTNTTTSVTAGLQVPKLTFKRRTKLETNDTTFAAVQGAPGTFSINFERTAPELADPFLSFSSPATARYVDALGRVLPLGSLVPLEVTVAEESLVIHFGPHGSTFGADAPAQLRVNLAAVELGDRSPSDLKLYYQATGSDAWTLLDTPVAIDGSYAVVSIYHFSNYALAF